MGLKQRSVSEKIDMINGSLMDKILFMAIPIALSSILQQLFNSVDVAVVGRFASDKAAATAAVGCNGPIINLIINLFIGISVGANVVIASHVGRGEKENANKAVHTSMIIAAVSGFILIFAGLITARPMHMWMNTPEEVMDYAVQYLCIYSLGMPFIMLYNFGAAALRAIGDTRRPLYCLIVSGVINAILNMFLVIVFHLDVAGVAIATVISNVISSGMVIFFLLHEKSEIGLDLKKLTADREDIKKILRLGLPTGIQFTIFSISNICIQAALNGFGTDAVAGSAVSLNYEDFVYFGIAAVNQAVVTFTSQNYAAGRYERCRKIFTYGLVESVAICVLMSAVFLMWSDFFISIFTVEPEVAYYASLRLKLILMFNFIECSYEISVAALRGMGYSLVPAVLTVFGTCILRLIWVFTLCRVFHSFTLLIAVYPISWLVTGVAVTAAYFIIRKKAYGTENA